MNISTTDNSDAQNNRCTASAEAKFYFYANCFFFQRFPLFTFQSLLKKNFQTKKESLLLKQKNCAINIFLLDVVSLHKIE